MKDQNFAPVRLELGTQRSWFVRQIARDADFLRSHNIVDYSLLVGIQNDFEQSPHFDNLVGRISRYVSDYQMPDVLLQYCPGVPVP